MRLLVSNTNLPQTRTIVRPDVENRIDRIFIRLDKTPECVRQTDGRTYILSSYTVVCIASNADAL